MLDTCNSAELTDEQRKSPALIFDFRAQTVFNTLKYSGDYIYHLM
jgi:hypothetical protein